MGSLPRKSPSLFAHFSNLPPPLPSLCCARKSDPTDQSSVSVYLYVRCMLGVGDCEAISSHVSEQHPSSAVFSFRSHTQEFSESSQHTSPQKQNKNQEAQVPESPPPTLIKPVRSNDTSSAAQPLPLTPWKLDPWQRCHERRHQRGFPLHYPRPRDTQRPSRTGLFLLHHHQHHRVGGGFYVATVFDGVPLRRGEREITGTEGHEEEERGGWKGREGGEVGVLLGGHKLLQHRHDGVVRVAVLEAGLRGHLKCLVWQRSSLRSERDTANSPRLPRSRPSKPSATCNYFFHSNPHYLKLSMYIDYSL